MSDLLRAARALLQRFRRRRVVLFNASSPMNLVVLAPVLAALQRDPRIELVLTGKYRGSVDPAALLSASGLAGVRTLKRAAAKRLAADLYLSPDGCRYGKRALARALCFHGASFKGRTLSRRARWFHRVFLLGEYQRRRFGELGVFAAEDPRLALIGMPKLDALARGEVDPAPVRALAGAKPGELLVLYAPTWGPESSLALQGEELIGALAARPATRVLVKFHDHSLDPSRGGIDWPARARAWRWPNVTVSPGADVVPALAAADVLVTDASSVAQEFCLLDRPIVFAGARSVFASERYRATADTAAWGTKAGIEAATPEEARAALDRAAANPGEHSAVRQALARDVFHDPGRATERAVAEVYALLRLRRPQPDR